MKYLRAIIRNSTGRPIYKKDFEPQKVFEIYTRQLASLLITTGTFRQGKYYSASFTPCYGKEPVLAAVPVQTREEPQKWIMLTYTGKVNPEIPIDFFLVELTARDRVYTYRAVLIVDELIYFWLSIEQLLVQIALLPDDEDYSNSLYARDDDEADFEHEEIFTWEEDASLLVEIVPDRNSTALLASKALTDFQISVVKKLEQNQLVTIRYEAQERSETALSILMTLPVLESVQKIACSNTSVEQGGWLVGDIYENASQSGFLVAINGFIPAEKTFANEVELRYTFESWQRQKTILTEHYPTKRIVGWYHTHLDLVKHSFFTDSSGSGTFHSALFFSQDDSFTHRQFFAEKWYVAMVLNSEGNLIFFKWQGDEIVEERTFYLIDQEEA